MKRFFIALIGGTVVLIGVAMMVLPGPAIVVIPAGLAILATEFLWARRVLNKTKRMVVYSKRRRFWPRFFRRKWAAAARTSNAVLPGQPPRAP